MQWFCIQLNMLCAKDIFHKYIILSTILYILKSLSVNVEAVSVVLLFWSIIKSAKIVSLMHKCIYKIWSFFFFQKG